MLPASRYVFIYIGFVSVLAGTYGFSFLVDIEHAADIDRSHEKPRVSHYRAVAHATSVWDTKFKTEVLHAGEEDAI